MKLSNRVRPNLLQLEARRVPASITVLNSDDAGAGSLRQALLDANGSPGSDQILFDPTAFATPQTITLLTGELLIGDSVSIIGPGADLLTVSGNNSSRVLHVGGPGTLDVTISGLTVTHGMTTDGPTFADSLGDGAGIQIEDENVVLDNVVVSDNTSLGEGGGIGVGQMGRLSLRNCTVSGNSAGGAGGGVYFIYEGNLLVEDCTISGNTALYLGGGIYFYANNSPSTAVVRNSTISGNSAFGGGGIYSTGPDLLIENCTITENTSVSMGGGIYLFANGPSTATIRSCTISGNAAGDGGGVAISFYGSSSATVENCAISGNTSSGSGGGLDFATLSSSSLSILNSTISGNTATENGGGLDFSAFLSSSLSIFNSTISGNMADLGGGVDFVSLYSSSLSILNSTISGNTAESIGGGIAFPGSYLEPTLTSLTVSNSTISGNTTNGSGGGIWMYLGTLTVQNSTITGNSAASGGGIYLTSYGATLQSTIVAGNSIGGIADITSDLSCLVSLDIAGENNLIGIMDPSNNATLTGSGNLTGTVAIPGDPLLGPLADNGGPTQTHSLLAGSPAIDAGNNFAGALSDQRGGSFDREFGAAPDIGALELQPGGAAPTVMGTTVNAGAAQRSRVTTLDITFSTQVTFAGSVASAFTLTRSGGGTVLFTATANVVAGVTVVTIGNFSGAETESGSVRDGNYTLTAVASQISADGQRMANDYTFGDAQGLYRFYGDMNGDRRVDSADFGFFSLAYLNPLNFNNSLDFNNDGRIDIADFGQFSVRFFTTLP